MANANGDHIINDTGIYQSETICFMQNEQFVPGGREKMEEIFKAHNRSLDLDVLLADSRRLGMAILNGHAARFDRLVVENGERKVVSDAVPSNRYPYRTGPNAPPMVADAAKMMFELDTATSALQSADIREFGLHMYWVGRFSERVYVRQFEGSALTGKKTRKGQSESRRKRREASLKRSADIVKRWKEIDSHGAHKAAEIDRKVAQEMGCSTTTVGIARSKAGLKRR